MALLSWRLKLSDIIIVGAGHAAGQAAASLRQEGFAGAITILGDEPAHPLSTAAAVQAVLGGGAGVGPGLSAPGEILRRQGHHRAPRCARRAHRSYGAGADHSVGRDPGLRKAAARHGQPPAGGSSCLAASSKASTTCAQLPTWTPSRPTWRPRKRVVVVGGGYIGLEVAAVCVEAGLEVDVLEMEQRILARVTTPAHVRLLPSPA